MQQRREAVELALAAQANRAKEAARRLHKGGEPDELDVVQPGKEPYGGVGDPHPDLDAPDGGVGEVRFDGLQCPGVEAAVGIDNADHNLPWVAAAEDWVVAAQQGDHLFQAVVEDVAFAQPAAGRPAQDRNHAWVVPIPGENGCSAVVQVIPLPRPRTGGGLEQATPSMSKRLPSPR